MTLQNLETIKIKIPGPFFYMEGKTVFFFLTFIDIMYLLFNLAFPLGRRYSWAKCRPSEVPSPTLGVVGAEGSTDPPCTVPKPPPRWGEACALCWAELGSRQQRIFGPIELHLNWTMKLLRTFNHQPQSSKPQAPVLPVTLVSCHKAGPAGETYWQRCDSKPHTFSTKTIQFAD